MTTPDEDTTPSTPDVDQPDGGDHGGQDERPADGGTPSTPDVDQPEGGTG